MFHHSHLNLINDVPRYIVHIIIVYYCLRQMLVLILYNVVSQWRIQGGGPRAPPHLVIILYFKGLTLNPK